MRSLPRNFRCSSVTHLLRELARGGFDDGRHGVRLTGAECHGVRGDVCGLDANEVLPLARAEVGHGARLVGPRVPDNGGQGVLFCDGRAALLPWVEQFQGAGRVQVDPVRLGGEADIAGLRFLGAPVGLVDEAS